MKSYYSKSGWYKLSLPDGFAVDDEQIPISIYDAQEGVGTVQISVFEVEDVEVDLRVEIENFITSSLGIRREALPNFKIETLADKRVIRVNGIHHENRCHLVWLIHQKRKVALITYNALCDDFAKEISRIEAIADSLELMG